MMWIVIPALILLALAASALFSGAETGLYCASRVRLHLSVQRNEPRASRVSGLLEDQQAALNLTLVGTNVSNYLATVAVAYMFAELIGVSDAQTELYTVALLTPVVFVFGELVPKSLFQRDANLWLMRCGRVLTASYYVLRYTCVLWLVRRLTDAASRLTVMGGPGYNTFEPKQRVALLLQEALADHATGDDQSYLIDKVVRLSEMPVHAVMVPRNRVATVSAAADRRELSRLARKTGFSRLPVHDNERRRAIIGVIEIDGLLETDDWRVVSDLMHPIDAIGPHDTVAAAIHQMQQSRSQIAVVTDRGGRMLGVVTLRGLLAELFGELAADVESPPLWG